MVELSVLPNASTSARADSQIRAWQSTPTTMAPARAADRAMNVTMKSTQPTSSPMMTFGKHYSPPKGGINPAVAYRQSQCGPLGNTILIGIYGQGYITAGFVVIGVAASYLRRARFIEEARLLPSMTLWLLTVRVPLQLILRPGAGTPPPLKVVRRLRADCALLANVRQCSSHRKARV
jgi:hypothetical protein